MAETEREKCPICHGYLFSDDDIVHCITCGAPHHRDCYKSVGHCGLEEYHGTELEYKKPEVKEEPAESTPKTEAEPKPFGEQNGNPFGASPVFPGNAGFNIYTTADMYGGYKETDSIDGVTAKEMRETVVINSTRYIPRFFALNKSKKSSWNWAAFLLPSYWLFFRKCYLPGILTFILLSLGEILTSAPILFNYAEYAELTTYTDIANMIMEKISADYMLGIMVIAGAVISLAVRIVLGIFGDCIYRNKVLTTVKTADEGMEKSGILNKKEYLARKGGVNIFAALLCLIASNLISSFAYLLF